MKKKLLKIILVLAIISCYYQNSISPIKGKEEQKGLLIYTGAHYPSGYKGFTNQYYYWFYGYGPAASYGKPSIYDINTGKLLFLSKYDWYHMDVFGRFLVLRDALVKETFEEYGKTYIYYGSKLILILKEKLLYINDQNWYAQGKNELSIYSTKTNRKISSYPLNANQSCVLVYKNKKSAFAVIDNKELTTKIVSFEGMRTLLSLPFAVLPYELEHEIIWKIGKGMMYEVNLSSFRITRMVKTPVEGEDINPISPERAINWKQNTLIDVITGKVLLTIKGSVSYKGTVGNNIIYCDYEGMDLRSYSMQDGKLNWQLKGKDYGGLFSYGERLLGNFNGNNRFACLDAKTGKTLWARNSFWINYFYSHFDEKLAYYSEPKKDNTDNSIFSCINLDDGKILWQHTLDGKEVSDIDFERGKYYIQEDYNTVKCFDLKTHKRIW